MSEDPRRVQRWMSRDLVTTKPGTALSDAIEEMEEHRIRHLPVIDQEKLIGLLSDRDARRCLGEGTENTTVRDVMTAAPQLKLVGPMALVRDAAETMCREKISALPVVEGERLLGIVTSEDLLWALLETTPE